MEPFGLSNLQLEYITIFMIIFIIGSLFRVSSYLVIIFIGIHLENVGVPKLFADTLMYGSCILLYFSRNKNGTFE